MRIDPIDPSEKVVIPFDFSTALADDETLQSATTTVYIIFGGDPIPSNVLNGAAMIDTSQKIVGVPVKGTIAGNDYAIKVVATTSNPLKTLAMVAVLPVRKAT